MLAIALYSQVTWSMDELDELSSHDFVIDKKIVNQIFFFPCYAFYLALLTNVGIFIFVGIDTWTSFFDLNYVAVSCMNLYLLVYVCSINFRIPFYNPMYFRMIGLCRFYLAQPQPQPQPMGQVMVGPTVWSFGRGQFGIPSFKKIKVIFQFNSSTMVDAYIFYFPFQKQTELISIILFLYIKVYKAWAHV